MRVWDASFHALKHNESACCVDDGLRSQSHHDECPKIGEMEHGDRECEGMEVGVR